MQENPTLLCKINIKLKALKSIKIVTPKQQQRATENLAQFFEANNLAKITSDFSHEEITGLPLIAKTHPPTAYSAFTSRYKRKFTFFMRTIKNFKIFLSPV